MKSLCDARPTTPAADVAELNELVGRAWGVTCGESIPQYLAWADAAGVFRALSQQPLTVEHLERETTLSPAGLDALLPLLESLGLVVRDTAGHLSLAELAREYLLCESPYYVGPALFWDCQKPMPATYANAPVGPQAAPSRPSWPAALRLKIPLSRNLGPAVTAVRSGEFEGLSHVLDIGGGGGSFTIPMALDHPDTAVTLVELPAVIDGVRASLADYDLHHRVTVVGMDALADEWRLPDCDGVYFGNLFHAFGDAKCGLLARRAFDALTRGGRVWIHEVVFNDRRDGPLVAALWNANVIARTAEARQRTAAELMALLELAGFTRCSARPTAGHFWLMRGTKA